MASPFLSKLAAEDRCHLNSLALEDGRCRYVTATSTSDVVDGWRDRRRDGGVVMEVPSGEIVSHGLSMPHSPRVYRSELWVHNSGTGYFGKIDRATGQFEPVTFCPGYLRGLAFAGDYAIAGGLRATGAVKTIAAHALLTGEIITGGLLADKLTLTLSGALGVAADSFAIATPQTISVLKAASVGSGLIQAGALTSITTAAGALAADVTSLGAIGRITFRGGGVSGDLVAKNFGAISVTGGGLSGSLTSTTPLAILGKTKDLTTLVLTGGSLSGDVNLIGATGAITVKAGSLSGNLTAMSFGAVSVTGGDFGGSLTSLTPVAAFSRTAKALTSLTVSDGNLTGDIRLLGASGAITVKAKPALFAAGSLTGASIVASAIASLTVARDVTSSIILAGAGSRRGLRLRRGRRHLRRRHHRRGFLYD